MCSLHLGCNSFKTIKLCIQLFHAYQSQNNSQLLLISSISFQQAVQNDLTDEVIIFMHSEHVRRNMKLVLTIFRVKKWWEEAWL